MTHDCPTKKPATCSTPTGATSTRSRSGDTRSRSGVGMGNGSAKSRSLETVSLRRSGCLSASSRGDRGRGLRSANERGCCRSGLHHPEAEPGRLTLNRCCSAIAGPDGLQHRSWYKGDLHELMCLGSDHASPRCVSWQARRVLIAMSLLKDRSTII